MPSKVLTFSFLSSKLGSIKSFHEAWLCDCVVVKIILFTLEDEYFATCKWIPISSKPIIRSAFFLCTVNRMELENSVRKGLIIVTKMWKEGIINIPNRFSWGDLICMVFNCDTGTRKSCSVFSYKFLSVFWGGIVISLWIVIMCTILCMWHGKIVDTRIETVTIA